MSALSALRSGAAALLSAQGETALATLVRDAQVEIAGPGETWSMGAREVTAHRIALVVTADTFVALTRDAARMEAVRAAFAQTMRSPETELADLHLELLLPGIDRTWGLVYRDASLRNLPAERPDPDAVRAGAAALLRAVGEHEGAEMLGRARLDVAEIEGTSVPLTRYVLQLATGDRARTWRLPELEERLRRAVHDAASRAAEQVVVELGVSTTP
ncbi:Hypothetical protein A7982_08468 [Minicystis rosea]|nr:Hypothetical protein A7982_08468 [Minicystis rosea]